MPGGVGGTLGIYGIRTRRAQEKGREERNAGDRRFWRAVAAIPRKRGREVNHKGERERERERARAGIAGDQVVARSVSQIVAVVVRLFGWLVGCTSQ